MIKAINRGINILDHVLVKGFGTGLQRLEEMKGLGSTFNFYCGQTEIKRQRKYVKIGKIWFLY